MVTILKRDEIANVLGRKVNKPKGTRKKATFRIKKKYMKKKRTHY